MNIPVVNCYECAEEVELDDIEAIIVDENTNEMKILCERCRNKKQEYEKEN